MHETDVVTINTHGTVVKFSDNAIRPSIKITKMSQNISVIFQVIAYYHT